MSATAPSTAPAPFTRYFALSAFWFGSSLHWLLLLLILIPAQVQGFVGDERKGTYLGLLVTTGAVIALLLPPLVGAYSDRVGRRMEFLKWGVVVNVLGLLVMAAAALALKGMAGYAVYVLGFLLVQLGNNAATAPYSALIPELVPPESRGRASGIMAFLQASGQLLGAVVAAAVGLLKLPVIVPFALVVLALVGSAVVTLRFVPEPPARTREDAPAIPLWQLFAHQAFLWVFITRVLFSLGQYSVQPFIQYYVADVLRRPDAPTVTSYMLACIIVGSIGTALLGGRLSDRYGRKPIISFAGFLMAVCAVMFLFAPNLGVALGLALLFGLGFGAFTSVDWALGADAMPSARSYARDMGVWHVAFVGPQLTTAPQGALLDWGNRQGGNLGYGLVFGVAAACFTLGVLLVGRIRGLK